MSDIYAPPRSELVEGAPPIREFQRFSAWWVFGLSVITFGMYAPYWLYSRTSVLNRLTDNRISPFFVSASLFFALCQYAGYIVAFFFDYVQLGAIMYLLGLLYPVLAIVWSFKVRNRLQPYGLPVQHEEQKWSGGMTFFFREIYLQYKINEAIDNLD